MLRRSSLLQLKPNRIIKKVSKTQKHNNVFAFASSPPSSFSSSLSMNKCMIDIGSTKNNIKLHYSTMIRNHNSTLLKRCRLRPTTNTATNANTTITKRNYIFFEKNNILLQIQQNIDAVLSTIFGSKYNSIQKSSYLKMQKGKQIMIKLKTNTREQMKKSIDIMRRRRNNNSLGTSSVVGHHHDNTNTSTSSTNTSSSNQRYSYHKFRQWRKNKQVHLTNYYKDKRSMFKHRTQHMLKKSNITSMKEWKLRVLLHNYTKQYKNVARKNITAIIKDFVKYSKHTVTIAEPFRKEWFSEQNGYPLTSKDPRSGRFVNPWQSESTNGWKRLQDVWRWKKTRFFGYDMEHSIKDDHHHHDATVQHKNTSICDFTKVSHHHHYQQQQQQLEMESEQPLSIPMQLSPPSSPDKIKLTWVGHSTMLVQQSGFTILTDPVFSKKASPLQYFSETEFFGVPRRLPPSFTIDDIPTSGVDICLISHDHYDHLDYNSVVQLSEKNLVRYWVVPLGLKEWLIKEANVDHEKIVELEWWESVKFTNKSNCNYFSKENPIRMEEVMKPFGRKIANDNVGKSLNDLLYVENREKNNLPDTIHDVNNELVLTCAPAQHWCSRTPFDRNTRLWCSWAVHTSSRGKSSEQGYDMKDSQNGLSFYFSGDTGYPSFPLFRQIGDYLGPFDLAAIPIGAYKPRFFMHDSHCDPWESVNIHKDIRSRRSVAIHWGTFPLANEPYDEPPELLNEAVKKESDKSGEIVDFKTISHGRSIESKSKTDELLYAEEFLDSISISG